MRDGILPRIGTFLVLVGLLFLIIFIGSILGKEVNLNYLLLSSATLFLGSLLLKARKKAESSRFSAVRKLRRTPQSDREGKGTTEDSQDDHNRPMIL